MLFYIVSEYIFCYVILIFLIERLEKSINDDSEIIDMTNNNEMNRRCKSCDENLRISPEKLERLIDIATRERPLASEEQYIQRIEHCRNCSGLQFGATCRYCGCLVEVRTRLQESTCPYPSAPRW